jgi:hypothetical protein
MARASGDPDLPRAYAEALRLHAAGVDDDGIAAYLHVRPDAVRSMLRVANAKRADRAPVRPLSGTRCGQGTIKELIVVGDDRVLASRAGPMS